MTKSRSVYTSTGAKVALKGNKRPLSVLLWSAYSGHQFLVLFSFFKNEFLVTYRALGRFDYTRLRWCYLICPISGCCILSVYLIFFTLSYTESSQVNTNRPDGNKIIASNINLEGMLVSRKISGHT